MVTAIHHTGKYGKNIIHYTGKYGKNSRHYICKYGKNSKGTTTIQIFKATRHIESHRGSTGKSGLVLLDSWFGLKAKAQISVFKPLHWFMQYLAIWRPPARDCVGSK